MCINITTDNYWMGVRCSAITNCNHQGRDTDVGSCCGLSCYGVTPELPSLHINVEDILEEGRQGGDK